MGASRNYQIDEFAAETGIKAAIGTRAIVLRQISKNAYELIQVIALEQSGIRDGDGYWSGCDPLGAVIRAVDEGFKRLQQIEQAERSGNIPTICERTK